MDHRRVLLLLLTVLLGLAACSARPESVWPVAVATTGDAASPTQVAVAPRPPAASPATATASGMGVQPSATAATPAPTDRPTETATPISPGGTPRPSATPLLATIEPEPTATARPSPRPVVIQSFVADRTEVTAGDRVTFSWATSGANHVMLVRTASGDLNAASWDDLPLSGSLVLEMQGGERDQYTFELRADNGTIAYDGFALATIVVRFPCPDSFFFPFPASAQGSAWDSCPAGPATTTAAAEQLFEGGRMIWLGSLARIYVFYCRPWPQPCNTFETFLDTWVPGDPESDPTIVPPSGLYQPVRGFGKLWREQPEVRQKLGWALAPEQGFASAYQRNWRTCADGGSHPGDLFLQASDGILLLDDGYGLWQTFP